MPVGPWPWLWARRMSLALAVARSLAVSILLSYSDTTVSITTQCIVDKGTNLDHVVQLLFMTLHLHVGTDLLETDWFLVPSSGDHLIKGKDELEYLL
jgi:hypothetical protein